MLIQFIRKIWGTRNDRVVKHYQTIVAKINELDASHRQLSDEDLKARTASFRERIAAGETLDALMPEAFAVAREAAFRAIGQRPYDVQILGAIALHEGHIAEMKTGEGKTLTATLAAYLNALAGEAVHIVTVNPYLAQRDATWMGQVFERLGMTAGCILTEQSIEEKKEIYQKDIVYGTNYELGYDYLRDNMVTRLDQRIMRGLDYAIVDEADSVLIDEARTPLIISGDSLQSSTYYAQLAPLVRSLTIGADGHLALDEKERTVHLTEAGIDELERRLRAHGILSAEGSMYDAEFISLLNYLDASLRAEYLYHPNVHYLVQHGQIVIIDEQTGRTLPGRRWPQLHGALEAKEGLTVHPDHQTLASITFQNFFRHYKKIAGMTGTAMTEQEELRDIYHLSVVAIPTHRPMIRIDHPDRIYLTQEDKYEALCVDVRDRHLRGQPVLIDTPTVEASEILSTLLHRLEVPHQVLNAKQHAREAKIIAQAGCRGAVTISASMAGRGTDILLGGDPKSALDASGHPLSHDAWLAQHEEVVALGGLHVIGSERNESRRADLQILGRAGRQGDPGSSQFYLSLEDSLIRIFASERMASLMRSLGMKAKEHIQSPMLDRAIHNAQHKVEQYYYGIRKNLLKYDDIANDQRELIYNERELVMNLDEVPAVVNAIVGHVLDEWIGQSVPEHAQHEWDLERLEAHLRSWGIHTQLDLWMEQQPNPDREKLHAHLMHVAEARLRHQSHQLPTEAVYPIWSSIMLQVIDNLWKNHLALTDHLRHGIHLRSYAQKNPAHEFTQECFELFYTMLGNIKLQIAHALMNLEIAPHKASQPRMGSYRITEES